MAPTGVLKSLSEEMDGQPEHVCLYLPSHLKEQLTHTERSSRVSEIEIQLHHAECLETLRQVRTASSQKAQMLMGKQKNARGEIANTHAQVAITQLTLHVTHAIDEYDRLYKALLTLGLAEQDLQPLQHLSLKHLEGLMTILKGDRELGERNRKMPWFWSVQDIQPGANDPSEDEEYTDAIRVEWFHGQERFRRWKEEEQWLQHKIASTLFNYHSRSKAWEELSQSNYVQCTPSYQQYCLRQSDVFYGLLLDGLKECQGPLRLVGILKPWALIEWVQHQERHIRDED
ncbi:hypothetical protein FRC11_006867 [Ceratobasidium sp. 423]|nr:hypothetical protein FRC11_006867 [Ceratobasidium sp. 423]